MPHVNFSALRQTKPHEFAIRFALGGLITALAGLIARKFGPGVGGLFLAFPAILPATATLIDKHVKIAREKAGLEDRRRAHAVVSLDAAGAARGSIALIVFAALVYHFMPHHRSMLVLVGSTLAWFAAAVGLWWLHRLRHRFYHWLH